MCCLCIICWCCFGVGEILFFHFAFLHNTPTYLQTGLFSIDNTTLKLLLYLHTSLTKFIVVWPKPMMTYQTQIFCNISHIWAQHFKTHSDYVKCSLPNDMPMISTYWLILIGKILIPSIMQMDMYVSVCVRQKVVSGHCLLVLDLASLKDDYRVCGTLALSLFRQLIQHMVTCPCQLH